MLIASVDMDNTDLSHSILELHKVPCPAGENFTHPEKKLHKILQRCWIKHPLKRPDFKYLVGFFKDYLTATDTDSKIFSLYTLCLIELSL